MRSFGSRPSPDAHPAASTPTPTPTPAPAPAPAPAPDDAHVANASPVSRAPAVSPPRSRANPWQSFLAYPANLAAIDFGTLAAELDAIFRRHGARAQPTPRSLLLQRGPLRAIATFVVESDAIARATVSHLRVSPFMAGIALVVHPDPALDAPLLVADIMVPPTGFARAFLDACGPGIGSPLFETRFRDPLAKILDDAPRLGLRRAPVPAWMAPFSSGAGGAGGGLRAGRGAGSALAELLARYVSAYLDALTTAERSKDLAANETRARAVRAAVRANGPAERHLTRAFGADFTSRYLKLLWRDDR